MGSIFKKLVRTDQSQAGLQQSTAVKTSAISATKALNAALESTTQNGISLYTTDRDEAFRWHASKNFPNPGHENIGAVDWFLTMSRKCNEDSSWDEAWSGFHHTLSGCLNLNLVDRLPDICWNLGRAHNGLAHYDLANMYLEVAYVLCQDLHKGPEMRLSILLCKAVVGKITKCPESVKHAYDRAEKDLFLSSSPLASGCAMTFFREGSKNAEWRRDGKPVRYCLVVSTGYYEVSLDLNRRLGNKKAISMILANLGDVYKELDNKEHARQCWNESLSLLQELGDQQTLVQVKEWMAGL